MKKELLKHLDRAYENTQRLRVVYPEMSADIAKLDGYGDAIADIRKWVNSQGDDDSIPTAINKLNATMSELTAYITRKGDW